MSNEAWHDLREKHYDKQGRRLATLGKGVLAVLILMIVSAFAATVIGIGYLVDHGAPAFALSAMVFGALMGIAGVVRAFEKPIAGVARIVEARRLDPTRPADSAEHHGGE
jgi:hypothetical protein